MQSYDGLTLGNLGELRLLDEIVLPLARELDVETTVGDDCAFVPSATTLLAITADVGPAPLLQQIDKYQNDLEAAGWLAVVASASDIATAGAKPLCMANCIDAPPSMLVDDLVSYLRGYFRACSEFGFRNGGGDLRHGPKLAARVFAVGSCREGCRVGRTGISENDRIIVVGPTGEFMAAYLLVAAEARDGIQSEYLHSKLCDSVLKYPRPKLKEMARLVEARLVVAASDTSDGLLGAIDNLVRGSHCGFELELDEALLPKLVQEAAHSTGIDPWNIFFAWGDWSVVIGVQSRDMSRFSAVCEDLQIEYTVLGHATTNTGCIEAQLHTGERVSVTALRNENFVTSGFNAGLDGHLDFILKTKLFHPLRKQ